MFSHKFREVIKFRTHYIYKPFIWRFSARKETCSAVVKIDVLVAASFGNLDDSMANCIPIPSRLIFFNLLVKVSLSLVTIQFIRFMDSEKINCTSKPCIRLIELSLPLQEASLRPRRTCIIVSDIVEHNKK